MSKFTLLFLFCFIFGFASAQDVEDTDGPGITWENLSIDMGTLNLGSTVSHKFYFDNSSTENLTIKKATASDVNAVLNYDLEPIPQNERSHIEVTYTCATGGKINVKVSVDVFQYGTTTTQNLTLTGLSDARGTSTPVKGK